MRKKRREIKGKITSNTWILKIQFFKNKTDIEKIVEEKLLRIFKVYSSENFLKLKVLREAALDLSRFYMYSIHRIEDCRFFTVLSIIMK